MEAVRKAALVAEMMQMPRGMRALTAARVQYRVSELELQRDLDVLEVNEQGLWREYTPETR